MKKLLSTVLCLCMLLSILPSNVFAATMISKSDITVNAPEAGVAPIAFASVFNQSLEVVNVEWVGELDGNGCFKANTAYTINITVRIKAGQDKYLVNQEGGFRVNKKKAVMTSLSGDGQEAVISYTFDNGAGSASVQIQPEQTPSSPTTAEPTALKDANFYVEKPVQGTKPSTVVTTDRSDVFDISGVKWTGDFDSNGCFIAKNTYRLHFNITVKDGVNIVIPSKGVESVRNYRLNGKLLTTGPVVNDGKQLQTGLNFDVELPKEAVDMDYVYSETKAEADRTLIYPDMIIVNEGESLKEDYVEVFNEKQMNSVRKVVLNYTYNKHHYGDGDTEPEIINDDPNVFQGFYNLEELWLGPNVDVADFLVAYADAQFGLSGSEALIPLTSKSSETQKLTLFVSDKSLPNGFTGDWNVVKSTIADDGYMELGTGPFRRFQSRLYSGDVLEAFKKGPSAAYEWCTQHDYSEIINTADRVYQMISCTQPTLYYYSCSKCGKCEYNPNHVSRSLPHLAGDYYMLRDRSDHHLLDRNLSEKYYIGVNSRGERVYWKSCTMCGGIYNEVEPDQQPTTPEWACENATVTKDYVNIAFAVKNDRYVSAKMSQWAQNEVQWASQNGILDLSLLGNDYTKPITRLQFASIAVKLAEVLTDKAIAPAEAGTFTDTDNAYALKAYASGITSGVSATEFNPDGTLTRQQMATFIHRALMYVRDNTNIRYTIYTPELEKYSDNWAIQDWARTPMGFMNALGLVKGVSDTEISPDGKCTIEQAAVVANRSVNADQIGWYQSNAGSTNRGALTLIYEHDYFHAPTESAPTQADYTNEMRIWVHSPMSGYQKASENPDVDIDTISACWLPTTYPFADFPMWVHAQDFKPIKELKADDEANFNNYYGK